ncbi:Peptidase M10 serralysin C terminal [Roseomonas rosea]|uniref:Peptidase M10 serralysin C terminal n=1 Tax=Muricoccus roseus TaxID=198092 RepID=A0A1M6PG74_9PROT|nr:calcium-binding protein [Roseomonas rosea]SHK06892.1 Peptidase M10 serralysin C terminal [Roseomonas rosea]
MATEFLVSDVASLNAAIASISSGGADSNPDTAYSITVTADILLAQEMLAINLAAGSSLTIAGGGHVLDGGDAHRGFFVYSGSVRIEDLSIQNTLAEGGDGGGGRGRGGGGAGLGGGLFVATGADVTLRDVTFADNAARGGAGGAVSTGSAGGGGGGMGGDGGDNFLSNGAGGGGIGKGAAGADAGVGTTTTGIVPGLASGGGAAGTEPNNVDLHTAGGGGGIGGAPGTTAGGTAGGFGGGGGGGSLNYNSATGYSWTAGGNGGFGGGGGGGGDAAGGNGGFGGGGGGGLANPGEGGFGGGNASQYVGGGGLGAGGQIFVQEGGSLTIEGGSLSGGTVAGGAAGGTGAGAGSAFGSGLFLQGSGTVQLAGSEDGALTIADLITDQAGSVSGASGAYALSITGGTVILTAANTYSGGTTIGDATLIAEGAARLGRGAVTFLEGADSTLHVGTLNAGNILVNFDLGDTLDLDNFDFTGGTTASFDGTRLTVSSGAQTTVVTLQGVEAGTRFLVGEDSDGSALITVFDPDAPVETNFTVGSADALNLALSLIGEGGLYAQAGTAYTITLTADLLLVEDLWAIDLLAGSTLSIQGNGHVLDGAGLYRGLFVAEGEVSIESLTIQDARAKGGNGAAGWAGGGGGAGLGGGLFVASGAQVTLHDVSFLDNRAVGGNGAYYNSADAGGGGGGMWGNGVAGNGATAGAGGSGVRGADFGAGTTGGLASSTSNVPAPAEFGGGGGGGGTNPGRITVGYNGGAGGFGGGGGGGGPTGGAGGFGAGAGASGSVSFSSTSYWGGGGGLGAGGQIFVQEGGVLTLSGSASLEGGAVTGGTRGSSRAGNGSAFGDGIFIQGSSTLHLAPGPGETLLIDDVIADQSGSGGTGTSAGAASLMITGGGTVRLSAANTYAGGTTLGDATLEIAETGTAGSGAVTFAGPEDSTLRIESSSFGNLLEGFSRGDVIDLQAISFTSPAGFTRNGEVVTVFDGTTTLELHLVGAAGPLIMDQDGDGSARLRVGQEAVVTSPGRTDFQPSGLIEVAAITFAAGAHSEAVLADAQLWSMVQVTGDESENRVTVNMVAPGRLDLSGWRFAEWSIGLDILAINGTDGADDITGTEFDDRITGGQGNDSLAGGTGDDSYFVSGIGTTVSEAAGGGVDTVLALVDFTLAEGSAVEVLRAVGGGGLQLAGNELANWLVSSGAGIGDALAGGGGNDSYVVRSVADTVLEGIGQGIDTVIAGVSYTLAAGSEIEVLRADPGAAGLALTGNEFANRLVSGGAEDTLAGAGGNDLYYVDSAGDEVLEQTGEGIDTVFASSSWTLGAGQAVEILRANAGGEGITLTGNELANILHSGAGLDVLAGGAGNDTYYVGDSGDTVLEMAGGGTDTVYAGSDFTLAPVQEIEVLRASAGSTGLGLTGNAFANRIIGGAGGDTIAGGLGQDTLTGGSGEDSFVFTGLADSPASAARDYISDFVSGEDRIDLSAIQAVEGADSDQAFTFLGTGRFTKQAGQLHQITAGSNTIVEGDVNGDGRADFQILVKGLLTLQEGDFVL